MHICSCDNRTYQRVFYLRRLFHLVIQVAPRQTFLLIADSLVNKFSSIITEVRAQNNERVLDDARCSVTTGTDLPSSLGNSNGTRLEIAIRDRDHLAHSAPIHSFFREISSPRSPPCCRSAFLSIPLLIPFYRLCALFTERSLVLYLRTISTASWTFAW